MSFLFTLMNKIKFCNISYMVIAFKILSMMSYLKKTKSYPINSEICHLIVAEIKRPQ